MTKGRFAKRIEFKIADKNKNKKKTICLLPIRKSYDTRQQQKKIKTTTIILYIIQNAGIVETNLFSSAVQR